MNAMRWSVAVCLLVAGCATKPTKEPVLTNRALARAAAKCHAKSLGVHYSRTGKLPYGDYLVPLAERDDEPDNQPSFYCMSEALKGYRRDYLGLVVKDPVVQPRK